jgi:hypothetical protein
MWQKFVNVLTSRCPRRWRKGLSFCLTSLRIIHRINCFGLWRHVASQIEKDVSEGHGTYILNSEAEDGGRSFLIKVVIKPPAGHDVKVQKTVVWTIPPWKFVRIYEVCTNPGRQFESLRNFVQFTPIVVDSQYRTCFSSQSWHVERLDGS